MLPELKGMLKGTILFTSAVWGSNCEPKDIL